jgi:hypothetical protein
VPMKMTKEEDKSRSANEMQKDRTIFCINFEERVTEDILYELFLQVCNLQFDFEDSLASSKCFFSYKIMQRPVQSNRLCAKLIETAT